MTARSLARSLKPTSSSVWSTSLRIDARCQRCEERQRAAPTDGGKHEAFAHRMLEKQLRQLERAADAQAHDAPRQLACDVVAVEEHRAARGA